MPGGTEEAYKYLKPIVEKVAAQVDDGPCVTYIGPGGSGNFVKMVHNGIEYGDMQLIAEAYDILKHAGGLSNKELADVFAEWNKGELDSFLLQITSTIFTVKDDKGQDGDLVDYVMDKTGAKGTGKWTVQQAAELLQAAPTIAAALDARCALLTCWYRFVVLQACCVLSGSLQCGACMYCSLPTSICCGNMFTCTMSGRIPGRSLETRMMRHAGICLRGRKSVRRRPASTLTLASVSQTPRQVTLTSKS